VARRSSLFSLALSKHAKRKKEEKKGTERRKSQLKVKKKMINPINQSIKPIRFTHQSPLIQGAMAG
jgi:hypothetical protein